LVKKIFETETGISQSVTKDDFFVSKDDRDIITKINRILNDRVSLHHHHNSFRILQASLEELDEEYLRLNDKNPIVSNFFRLKNGNQATKIVNAKKKLIALSDILSGENNPKLNSKCKIGIISAKNKINSLKEFSCITSSNVSNEGDTDNANTEQSILSPIIFHANSFYELTQYAKNNNIFFNTLIFIGDKYFFKSYQEIISYYRRATHPVKCCFVGALNLNEYDNFKLRKIQHTYFEYRKELLWDENNTDIILVDETELDDLMRQYKNIIADIVVKKPEVRGIKKLLKYLNYIYSEFTLPESSINDKKLDTKARFSPAHRRIRPGGHMLGLVFGPTARKPG
jgi:hypothetical protein